MSQEQFARINRDVKPELLQSGEYPYAMNMIVQQGRLNHLVNEHGTDLCISYDGEIVGDIHLPHRNSRVLFISPGDTTGSQIILFDYLNCTTKVLSEDCDDFDPTKQIKGVFKTLTNCNEDVVYYINNSNVKYINIDKPENCSDVFDCAIPIKVNIEQVNNGGGSLFCGMYQFVSRYTDGSGNGTNWYAITDPIPVIDDNNSSDFKSVDGCTGTVPTGKSISIDLVNLSSEQKYVEIAVIKTIDGITTAEIIAELQFIADSLSYTYNGLPGVPTEIGEIIVPNSLKLNAQEITVHHDRLLIGKTANRQPLNYQADAMNIDSKWFTIRLPLDKDGLAYKNPLLYQFRGFMADEVYSLGIIWKYCDGSISPVFHIPGPNKQTVDNDFNGVKNYESILDLVAETDEDNFFECTGKSVWEVFNTATITDSPFEETSIVVDDCNLVQGLEYGVWQKGTLAYYESESRYPADKDCDGNYLYNVIEQIEDGEVVAVGQNIRYHRMPSRKLIPHFEKTSPVDVECPKDDVNEATYEHRKPYDDTYVYPIGLTLSNITIPDDPDITGYRIVYVQRTATNKSVLANGILHHTFTHNSDEIGQSTAAHPKYVMNDSGTLPITPYGFMDLNIPNIYKLHSPDTDVKDDKPFVAGTTHVLINGEYSGISRNYGEVEKGDSEGDTDEQDQVVIRFNTSVMTRTETPLINRKIEGNQYVNAHSFATPSSGVTYSLNNLHQESGLFFETNSLITFINQCGFEIQDGGFTKPGNIYDDSYFPYESGADNCEDNKSNCVKTWNITLKRYQSDQYGDLLSQSYIDTGTQGKTESIDVFGDSFIGYYSYRRTAILHPFSTAESFPDPDLTLFRGIPLSTLVHHVYESDINVSLRHEDEQNYYPKLSSQFLDSSIPLNAKPENSFLSQYRYDDGTQSYINEGIDNELAYNRDFNKVNDIRRYHPDIDIWDCCDLKFIDRIAVSDVDDYSSTVDGWRTFRIANYIDVPSNYGPITNIFSLNNNLYAHTTDNMWRVFTSGDRVLTDASTVYIGNSSIFGQTPMYIYATAEGFGGLQQRHGTLLNEQGYFWIDEKSGNLYSFSDKIDILSDKGLKEFFDYNSESNGQDNHANGNVFGGWHIGFDHEYERLLITMRSNVDDCNKSWTWSYSYLTNGFVSMHKYFPLRYMNTRDKLLHVADGKIWSHDNEQVRNTYYDNYYPFEVEIVNKTSPVRTRILNSVSYWCDAEKFNVTYNKWHPENITFSHAIVYNSRQCSGIISLTNKEENEEYMMDSIVNIPGEAFVTRGEVFWSINGFWDEVTDQSIPFFKEECTREHPGVAILNSDAFTGSKEYWETENFRDTYHIIRLIADEDPDIRFTLKYVTENEKESYR